MAHIYEVGTRAWQPDPTEGWIASEVKEKLVDGDKVQLVFELENGEVRYQPPVTVADRSIVGVGVASIGNRLTGRGRTDQNDRDDPG